MKKISVVVPCFNSASYLHHCMDHLIGQTIGIENIEIILVDDASTDDGATWQAIMQYENRYPDSIIAVRLEENLRQGGARNVGVSYASGEYLLFCDSDDWLRVEALELLYNVITHENADVVEFCNQDVTTYDEIDTPLACGNRSREILVRTDGERRKYILTSTDELTFGCWNKIYSTQLIREHQIKFAEHLICEEPSFVLPVRLYAVKHVFLDAVLHYCFQNPEGTTKGSWNGHQMDNLHVWVLLFEDLKARGFIDRFPSELEYLFWRWGIELTIRMAVARGILMGAAELSLLKETAMKYCPNIRTNTYLRCFTYRITEICAKLLDMEFTQDNVYDFNQHMVKYIMDM